MNPNDYQPDGHLGVDYARGGPYLTTPPPRRNRMKILGRTLITAAFLLFLAAIWILSWQAAATGALLFLAGASILGNQNKPRPPKDPGWGDPPPTPTWKGKPPF